VVVEEVAEEEIVEIVFVVTSPPPDLIQTSVYDKRSVSTELTTHLDHMIHCEATSGTNWLNKRTYRVFIVNTRRD